MEAGLLATVAEEMAQMARVVEAEAVQAVAMGLVTVVVGLARVRVVGRQVAVVKKVAAMELAAKAVATRVAGVATVEREAVRVGGN